jgi:hypothetical protein
MSIDWLQTAGVGREVNSKNQNNLNLCMDMGGGLGVRVDGLARVR